MSQFRIAYRVDEILYDLIVLDLKLPRMEGLETPGRCAREPATLPFSC